MELKRFKDFAFYSLVLKKIAASLSKQGKVQKVLCCLQRAFTSCKFKIHLSAFIILLALERRVAVLFDLKSIKRGRLVYKVPVVLQPHKQLSRFVKLFVSSIRLNIKKTSLTEKLHSEIMAVHMGTSSILTRNQTMYQEAFTNRGFAHYRW